MNEARQKDYSNRANLSDFEGAAYVGVSRNTFRRFAQDIGCRRRVGRRVLNDKSVIDQALKRGGGA